MKVMHLELNYRRVKDVASFSSRVDQNLKALFYSFETVLNSYESEYKTLFQYNHLFQTVCLDES
jgi:hypothetical protein